MKRRLLFSAATLMMAAGLMAQTDITPSRLDFASQPVGQFTINGWNDGWGPINTNPEGTGTPDKARLMPEGYVNICGSMGNSGVWLNSADGTASANTINFQAGLNIYDFGGKVGKVLVYKGKNCTNPLLEGVTAATGGIPVMRPQLAFYPDYTKVETGDDAEGAEKVAPYIRASVLYKAISNEAWGVQGGAVPEIEVKTATGNQANVIATLGSSIPNMDMMISPDDDDYTIEQGWVRFEFDFQLGLPEANPFAFSLKLSNEKADMGGGEKAPFGWLDGGAVLVKEIKFTLGTDGTYKKGEAPHIEKGIDLSKLTGITSINGESNTPCCTIVNGVLSVSNIAVGDKIEIYNSVGMKVASDVTTADHATLPLTGKGLYIVSVNGKKSIKVFNN